MDIILSIIVTVVVFGTWASVVYAIWLYRHIFPIWLRKTAVLVLKYGGGLGFLISLAALIFGLANAPSQEASKAIVLSVLPLMIMSLLAFSFFAD